MKHKMLKNGCCLILFALSTLFVCDMGFAAGGKGNVKQLGEQIYIWHFDEGDGDETADETGNLVGEFTGDIEWAEGISGSALEFSGQVGKAQYVKVPHADELDIDEAITLAAWVFPNELPTGEQVNKFTIIFKLAYYLQLEPNGASIAYYFYETTAPGYHISNGGVKAQEWSHVAVVWNGDETRFYINGEEDANVVKQGGIGRSNQEDVKFGGEDAACCPRFFQGRIDDILIANYPMPQEDLQQMINETLAVSAREKLATTWGDIKKR